MDWKDHDRWAAKIGISKEVARYVNNLIDAIKKGKTLPQEYTDFVDRESKKEASSKKKVVAHFIGGTTLSHDSGRRNGREGIIATDTQLKFLGDKGGDYIDAWYLHHTLDYLNNPTIKFYLREYGIEEVLGMYKKNKPQTYSDKIVDFLKYNVQELKEELDVN